MRFLSTAWLAFVWLMILTFPATAGRTHAADSETVTMPYRDKPLPQDSAGRAARVGADSAADRAEVLGSSYNAVEAADAAHREGRKELMRCGARSD